VLKTKNPRIELSQGASVLCIYGNSLSCLALNW